MFYGVLALMEQGNDPKSLQIEILRSVLAMMEQRNEPSKQQEPTAPAQAISHQEPTPGNEQSIVGACSQRQQMYMPPSDLDA